MSDLIDRQAAIDACLKNLVNATFVADGIYNQGVENCLKKIKELPSAHTEWNNHTVACLLAELFDDTCACNFNDIDEWLPEKCELLDSCPNPGGVACWEQFLKHKAERRTDG